jgi:hypothetical protein
VLHGTVLPVVLSLRYFFYRAWDHELRLDE